MLDAEIVVEGVETKKQVDFIRNLECDMIQGYYYSKPIEKTEMEKYFSKKWTDRWEIFKKSFLICRNLFQRDIYTAKKVEK